MGRWSAGLVWVAVALLVLGGGIARADGVAPALRLGVAQLNSAPPNPTLAAASSEAWQLHENGAAMRRAGTGLVIAGAIAGALGMVAFGSTMALFDDPRANILAAIGLVLVVNGTVMLAT